VTAIWARDEEDTANRTDSAAIKRKKKLTRHLPMDSRFIRLRSFAHSVRATRNFAGVEIHLKAGNDLKSFDV